MPRRNHPKSYGQRSKRAMKGQHPLVPSPVVVICPSRKRGFPKHIAEEKLAVYSRDTTRRTVPQRVYHCDLCGSWHLTSQTKKDVPESS